MLGLALVLPAAGARAQEQGGPISYANMPPGWVWPPSEAMREGGRRCLAELAATGTPFSSLSEPVGKISMPVIVPAMVFGGLNVRSVRSGKHSAVMDCHLALSLVQQGPRLAALGVRTCNIYVEEPAGMFVSGDDKCVLPKD